MCIACVARNMERALQVCDVQVLGMNCMVSYLFRRAPAYLVYGVFLRVQYICFCS